METVGKLRSIIASVRNGIELGDTVETLEWCADTIERLTKERDHFETAFNQTVEKNKELIDLRCTLIGHHTEAHRWSQEALKQVGEIKAERDAARAEVESLKKQIGGLEYHLEAARGEVGRLKGELREGFDAEGSGIELRRRMDAMGR